MFKLKDPTCLLPVRATPHSVGLDIFLPRDLILRHNRVEIIDTGFSIQPPEGFFCKVENRSGLALAGIVALGGIIDPDFEENLRVLLNYFGEKDQFELKAGARIAQLVFYPLPPRQVYETAGPPLSSGKRKGGFGSTGL